MFGADKRMAVAELGSDLSRLPVERLAALLMEWALEKPRLLVRSHATVEENQSRGTDEAA